MELESFSVGALTRRRPLIPVAAMARPDHRPTPSNAGHEHDPLLHRAPQRQQQKTSQLKRSLDLLDLVFYGVGCSVGAGIYSLVGIGANLAGPAIALSFLLCGVACCFTSLCYAEFAARVPLAGSAYTFTYVSFGELCGWLVGWNLTLGYAVSAAVVARSWAEYLVHFLHGTIEGVATSHGTYWSTTYLTKFPISFLGNGNFTCCPLSTVILAFCTIVLVTGVKESARFNTAMTILNLTVLGCVLMAGIGSGVVSHDNLQPVFPHGVLGMARGAGLVFFSYLGFDMVACLSEEVNNPKRNMPIGIIGSLMLSMAIYVAVSVVIVGMAPISLLGEDVPILNALLANACCTHVQQLADGAAETCLSYHHHDSNNAAACHTILHPVLYLGSRVISFGAIFGLTTATFACLMGQPRIFYSMAQDGLLFPLYAKVHSKTGVPTTGTVITGIFTALIACFVDLESLANAISLGTLQVFTFVCAGIILLRTRQETDDQFCMTDAVELEEEPSPPIAARLCGTDPEAATIAKWLGLVQETSVQLRDSLRKSHSLTVSENGTKPVWMVIIFTVASTLTASLMASGPIANDGFKRPLVGGLVLVIMVTAIFLFQMPQSPSPDTFACPMVPFVPLMGILCNSYMMGSMPGITWLIIAAWLFIGLLFYFGYGIHHSKLRVRQSKKATAVAGLITQGQANARTSSSMLSPQTSSTTTTGEYQSVASSSESAF